MYNGYRLNNLYKEAEKDIIDDLKDEINHLKKKMKDYKQREDNMEDELGDMSYDNKKLKKEIEKVFEESNKIRKSLEERQNKEEDFVKKEETFDILIKNLEKKNQKLEEKLVKADSIANEKEDELKVLKFKLNADLNKQSKAKNDRKEQISNLEKDNVSLMNINFEKEELIIKLSEENKRIKEELEGLEIKNSKREVQSRDDNEPVNLFNEMLSAKMIESCEMCKKTFNKKNKLKSHRERCHSKSNLKQYLSEIKTTLSSEREQLKAKIFQVRENEIIQKYSCNSSCVPTCRIFHQKHDWVKPVAEDLLKKFQKTRSIEDWTCDMCSKYFKSLTEVNNHNKTTHALGQMKQLLGRSLESNKHSQNSHCISAEEVFIDISNLGLTMSVFNSIDEERNEKILHDSDDSRPKHVCNICLSSFQSKTELSDHIMAKHKEIQDPLFSRNCEVCC